MPEFKYAEARIRPNSRGFVWIAWTLFAFCFLATGAGVIGAFQLEAVIIDYQKRKVLANLGWAIRYLDSYFLMTVISIIWIQVCSVSADTEKYLVSLERKVDELLAKQTDSNQDDVKKS